MVLDEMLVEIGYFALILALLLLTTQCEIMVEGSPGLLQVRVSAVLGRLSLPLPAFLVGGHLVVDTVDANVVTNPRRCLAHLALRCCQGSRGVGTV